MLHRLLDRLGLPAYRLEVETDGDPWRILIECETADAHQRLTLEIRHAVMSLGLAGDRQVQDELARRLDGVLCDCLRVV
jgi:hypothetical protein